MASITFDKANGGLDVRRGPSVSEANRLRQADNVYITTGGNLQKRPCLTKVATLEAGTVGLIAGNGVLNTFYGDVYTTITHANTFFKSNLVSHNLITPQTTKVHFGEVFNGFLYVAVEYSNGSILHHYLDGTTPTRIVDVNCPNTKEVIKQQSKIYAKGNQNVRYCATNIPRDWTAANDAGFLPTGVQAIGSTTCTALGQFGKSKLTVFSEDGIQVWSVDPNPSLNAIDSIVPNIGTRYSKSPIGFGGDIFFLSDQGYRSITVSNQTDNLRDVDIGSAIDLSVLPTLTASSDPISVFYAGLGQFWSIDGNTVWVYSFSRTAKLSAWSKFILPITVNDRAVLNGNLYLRSGDTVYVMDKDVFTDDGAVPTVTIEMPFLDFKTPGVLKQITGVDTIGIGNATLKLKYLAMVNGVPTEFISQEIPIISNNTTAPGTMTAVEICATAVAPIITHSANQDFRLDSLTFYYQDLSFDI